MEPTQINVSYPYFNLEYLRRHKSPLSLQHPFITRPRSSSASAAVVCLSMLMLVRRPWSCQTECYSERCHVSIQLTEIINILQRWAVTRLIWFFSVTRAQTTSVSWVRGAVGEQYGQSVQRQSGAQIRSTLAAVQLWHKVALLYCSIHLHGVPKQVVISTIFISKTLNII